MKRLFRRSKPIIDRSHNKLL